MIVQLGLAPVPWEKSGGLLLVSGRNQVVSFNTMASTNASREANRDFVMLAVNNHAALVKALEGVIAAWLYEASQGDGIMQEHKPAHARAVAVLNRVKGGA